MISDSFSSTATLAWVQAAVSKYGATNVVLTILGIGLAVLASDYAHMVYLHYRMVRSSKEENSSPLLTNDSRQDRSPYPS